jgi:hypothetical protein
VELSYVVVPGAPHWPFIFNSSHRPCRASDGGQQAEEETEGRRGWLISHATWLVGRGSDTRCPFCPWGWACPSVVPFLTLRSKMDCHWRAGFHSDPVHT